MLVSLLSTIFLILATAYPNWHAQMNAFITLLLV